MWRIIIKHKHYKIRNGENINMNANAILSEEMTLDEKLAAIDAAMAAAVTNAQQTSGTVNAPLDPADLTMCLGCQ